MDLSDKLKEFMGEYVENVKERVSNPAQTLATALEEGMPTEENPMGLFGLGGATRLAKKIIPEGTLTSRLARTDTGDIFWEIKGGKWIDEKGKLFSQDQLLKTHPTAYPIPKREGPIREGEWSQIDAGKSSFADTRKVKIDEVK